MSCVSKGCVRLYEVLDLWVGGFAFKEQMLGGKDVLARLVPTRVIAAQLGRNPYILLACLKTATKPQTEPHRFNEPCLEIPLPSVVRAQDIRDTSELHWQ